LLLQRFAQLVKQPRVLDGDNRLRGEIRHQFDLLIRERANLLSKEVEGPDQLALLQHWNAEHGANTSCFETN
jgi:hypothetical protein